MTEPAPTGSNKLTRRRVTSAAVVGGVTATLMARPTAANAAVTTYTPVAYTKTRLAGSMERHIANRFGYGWTPTLGKEIALAGGWRLWFERQLTGAVDDTFATTSATWWPSINASTGTIWARHEAGTEKLWETMHDYKRWCLVRRIHSKKQVLESMTEFWENHLHVPAVGEEAALFRIGYGKGIRQRALGTFEDLLQFAITHPAMGCYLHNAVSKKSAPNEDLGRELLELHTVGRGNYTETDVVNSARILTGYRVDIWDTWSVAYAEASHWLGLVKVMGFTDTNLLPDGRATTMRYLSYLAKHPATAKRIARKLAVHFVSDNPSQALVDDLASVYLANGTAIKPVLRALVNSSEFAASAGKKVRTPEEDVVATYRALGVKVRQPTREKSAANEILWQSSMLGSVPFGWPRPDGRPDHAQAWASTSRMLGSFKLHNTMAGGWFPTVDVTYASWGSWMPADTVRFDYLVDHLARKITGRRSTASLLRACSEAVAVPPLEKITRSHQLVQWKMPRLITTLLDHPAHMTR
jgi:hypothetical protein